MLRRWTLAAVGLTAVLGWGEWLNRRWSHTLVSRPREGTLAIVVLGFRNPQSTANLVNRSRVRVGLRSIEPGDREVTVVFSGGGDGRARSEARLMADYARSAYDGPMLLEDQSRTTWENITNVLPLVEGADRIKVASQPAHALKARAYVRRQRPDLAERLVAAADYRPGEWLLIKPLLALYGLWTLRGLTRDERRVGSVSVHTT